MAEQYDRLETLVLANFIAASADGMTFDRDQIVARLRAAVAANDAKDVEIANLERERDETLMLAGEMGSLKELAAKWFMEANNCIRLTALNAELVQWLEWVLPLARGYAHHNPVGNNAVGITQIEAVLAKAKATPDEELAEAVKFFAPPPDELP